MSEFFEIYHRHQTMSLLGSKIKNLLQSNRSIGKIDSQVPGILSNTAEIFLTDLISTSLSLIYRLGKKKLRTKHLKYVLKKKFRFNNFIKKKIKGS